MAKSTDPGLFQVKNTFTTVHKGLEVTYLAGEVVHPDDPLLKKMPEHFGALEFPHDPEVLKAGAPKAEPEPTPEPEPEPDPLARQARAGGQGTLGTPEIRS